MKKEIAKGIYSVGVSDWNIRNFHGYLTKLGSSYNSYLVVDDKITLIDTVKAPFADEHLDRISEIVEPEKIDYLICNHVEMDHSGSMPKVMERAKNATIITTATAQKELALHYDTYSWKYQIVKSGDSIKIGQHTYDFVLTPMVHWPDNMVTYNEEEKILFSNDAFGQHYATSAIYNALVDQNELFVECLKYYSNILTPYNSKVIKKIEEILSLNLPLDMICPSHGVIWRDNPTQIVELYLKWAQNYQENQITILYDTMWESTRDMAEAIAKGIKEADSQTVIKLIHLSKKDKNDVITEVFKSKAILVGSPTVNKGILTTIASLFEFVKSLEFKNKQAAAFGSFGWSGESVKLINAKLTDSGFALVNEGLRVSWKPDEETIKECVKFGKDFVKDLNK